MFSQIVLLLVLQAAPSAAKQAASAPKPATGFAQVQSLVETRQYLSLESGIANTRLEVADAALFRGILANRRNRLRDSIDLLDPMAAKLAAAPASWREKELLATLADDYSKTFEYARAEATFSRLLQRYGASLTKREHRNFSNRLSEMHVLRAAPPQTLEKTSPSMLTAKINGIGLLEVPVEAGGKSESWVMDTGANTCVITETTARRIGLQPLEGTATTDDISGLPVSFRIGVLPELKIGNTVLHNVELPITADKNLNFGGTQIQGIIGFPVQSALGSFSVYADGRVGIDSDPPSETTAEIFMEQQTPLVAAKAGGETLLFSLDTGATGSMFSARFHQMVKSKLTDQPVKTFPITGAGGTQSIHGYEMKDLVMTIAGEDVRLKSAGIFSEATGGGVDDVYGNLGQDLLRSFKSYTVDFRGMMFSVEPASR